MHRTASLNEMSLRYTELDEVEYYTPERWRGPDGSNKQGSWGSLPSQENSVITGLYKRECASAIHAYHKMLDAGVAAEMARQVLPVSVYTKWFWLNDLHNTWHFLRLRMDSHASWEIQQYAKAMHELMHQALPINMEIFDKYEAIQAEG